MQQNCRRRPRRRRCRRRRRRRSRRQPYDTKHKGYKLKLQAKPNRSTQLWGSLPWSPPARSPEERGRGLRDEEMVIIKWVYSRWSWSIVSLPLQPIMRHAAQATRLQWCPLHARAYRATGARGRDHMAVAVGAVRLSGFWQKQFWDDKIASATHNCLQRYEVIDSSEPTTLLTLVAA
jgi:hypothetical protein